MRDDPPVSRPISEDTPLRAAVVGAGVMGRWHARAIEASGGSVAAVVDPDLDRARALGGRGEVAPSLEHLLERGTRLEVVHVCAPVDAHASTVRAAVGAGLHVVCEKPVARDAETTRSLVELAGGAGRLLVPVHQFLFQPGVRRLVAHEQELGRLVRCTFVAASAGAEKTGIEPDELVSEILPHPLSLFTRLVPGPVGKLDWVVVRPGRGELRAVAVSEGTSLEIVVTSSGRPTRTELEVTGTEATALADLFHGFSVLDRGRATRARKVARPFTRGSRTVAAAATNLAARAARREPAYPGLRELVRQTYAAVRAGGPSPIPPAEVLAVADARARILERLADASRLLPSGRPVALGGESAVP